MSDGSQEWDPIEQARWSTEFFGPLVPGQLGCVFDHSAKDLVVGHIDVTENLHCRHRVSVCTRGSRACRHLRGDRSNNIAQGNSFTTIELKSNFLASARVGERVTCRCVPVHLGRQTHVWDATVTNEANGRTMALFRCTQMVLAAR